MKNIKGGVHSSRIKCKGVQLTQKNWQELANFLKIVEEHPPPFYSQKAVFTLKKLLNSWGFYILDRWTVMFLTHFLFFPLTF